jgi:toxin HigB-1
MIASFADQDAEALFHRGRVKRIGPQLQRVALRKLRYLEAAKTLDDLRVPPGNRLEALKGDHAGQHSIRINEQWRIVFTWREGNAHDVAFLDYH